MKTVFKATIMYEGEKDLSIEEIINLIKYQKAQIELVSKWFSEPLMIVKEQ